MPTPRERTQAIIKDVQARLDHIREVVRAQLEQPEYGVIRAAPKDVIALYEAQVAKYGSIWKEELPFVDGGQELESAYRQAKEKQRTTVGGGQGVGF